MAVKSIPEGYHTVTPYLTIEGASEAISLYQTALGAHEKFRMPTPDGRVAHAELQIGDSTVMVSDAVQSPATRSSHYLYVSDCDALFARATAAGMTAKMPPTDMFWGDRYGMVEDRFGNTWSIATHKEDVPPEEIGKRAAAAMGPK